VVILPIIWFFLILVIAGISSILFHISFEDGLAISLGKVIVTIILLLLIWKMDWLRATSITNFGNRNVWLVTLVTVFYFVCASLYSFYNQLIHIYEKDILLLEQFLGVKTGWLH